MGRCPVGKRFQHVAKTLLNDVFRQTQDVLEDFLLQIGLVDTDASTPELYTV